MPKRSDRSNKSKVTLKSPKKDVEVESAAMEAGKSKNPESSKDHSEEKTEEKTT